jgi:hypothetical protein
MQNRMKSTLILAGVLVILVILAIAGDRARKERRNPGEPLYPGLQTEQVSRVVVSKDTVRVELSKSAEGTWLVASEGSHPADMTLVDKLLEVVPKFHTRDLLSENPEKQELFEVTDSLGTEVLLEGSGGAQLAHFYVGKQGPDFMSSYLRPAEGKKVLLVPQYLKSTFDTGRDTWRDKTIFSFSQDDVTRAELRPAGQETIALAKGEEGKWSIVAPESLTVKESVWTSTLRIASNLKCDGFPEETPPLAEIGLDPPEQEFLVEMSDGRRDVLKIGGEDEASHHHYAMKGDDPTLYFLSKGRVSTLVRNLDILREDVPPGAEHDHSGD